MSAERIIAATYFLDHVDHESIKNLISFKED